MRLSLRRALVAMVLAMLATAGTRAADSADVRSLMTPAEFEATGLGKLSPAEMEALNAWLVRYTAREAPVMRNRSDAVQAEIEAQGTEVIRSRIVGKFRGWTGTSEFQLENGQVWRQRRGGTYSTVLESPEVEIRKNVMGYWQMRVTGSGKSTGVRRIK